MFRVTHEQTSFRLPTSQYNNRWFIRQRKITFSFVHRNRYTKISRGLFPRFQAFILARVIIFLPEFQPRWVKGSWKRFAGIRGSDFRRIKISTGPLSAPLVIYIRKLIIRPCSSSHENWFSFVFDHVHTQAFLPPLLPSSFLYFPLLFLPVSAKAARLLGSASRGSMAI